MQKKSEIIYESEHLIAVHSEHGSDTVISPFNPLGQKGRRGTFWGKSIMDKLELSAVGFVAQNPNWYPPDDMMRAIDAALPRIAGRKLVTYGHSQGGYGAMKYGRLLNAHAAYAFSPQWSINPAHVADFDFRFTSYYDSRLRGGDPIEKDELCPRNFLFYDEAHPYDEAQTQRLLALGDSIRIVRVPFAGHGSIRIVSEGRIGRPLIGLFVSEDNPTPEQFRALIRQGRQKSKTYLLHKVARLEPSHVRHRRFLIAGLKQIGEGAELDLAMARMHATAREFGEATRYLGKLSDEQLLTLDLRSSWRGFYAAGYLHGETRVAPLLRKRYPQDLFMRLNGVDTLIRTGDLNDALEELQGLAAWPNMAVAAQEIIRLFQAADRVDLAAAVHKKLLEQQSLSLVDRRRVSKQLLETYHARGLRDALGREFLTFLDLAGGDEDLALETARMAIRFKDLDSLLPVLDRFPALAEKHPFLTVYRAAQAAGQNSFKALADLRVLMNARLEDFAFWDALAEVAARLLTPKEASAAMARALTLATQEQVAACQLRQVELLFASDGQVRAFAEIKRYLAAGNVGGKAIQSFIDMAWRFKDKKLTEELLSYWLGKAKDDLHANFMGAKIYSEARNPVAARRCIEAVHRSLQGGTSLPPKQFTALATLAAAIDYGLEKRTFELAHARYPNDLSFMKNFSAERDAFAAKFASPPPPSNQPTGAPAGLARMFKRLLPGSNGQKGSAWP